jgi:RNA polymerase sigma-70 factor, ECF subfamily
MSDFHLLLQEQIPQLMRYASALTRDPDAAAELVEDTVRQALAEKSRRPQPADLRVWLLTILHELRDNPFRQAIFPAAQLDRDPRAALTLSDLDRALGQLPETERAPILLVGLEGLSCGDCAAILHVPPSTLRSRLARARGRLCRALGVEEKPQVANAA